MAKMPKEIKVNIKLPLWSAIKLRIAGKRCADIKRYPDSTLETCIAKNCQHNCSRREVVHPEFMGLNCRLKSLQINEDGKCDDFESIKEK